MSIKKKYSFLNKLVKRNGIVLLGSTSLDEPAVNELLQGFPMSQHVYNRSISGLTIADAEKYLEQCVYELFPSRVIINLGEEDLKYCDSVTQLIEQYRWLLYKIHVSMPKCQLVVTTVSGKEGLCENFNEELKKLAEEFGCTFYRIPEVLTKEEFVPTFLSTIKLSLYDSNLRYSDIATKAVLDFMMQ